MKRFAIGIVATVMLAIWVSSAGATQGGSASFAEVWTVPAECGAIGALTFTGTIQWNFDGTGAVHTTIKGTALDENDISYVFNYRNNYKGVFDTNNEPVAPFHMTDHFNLVGNGNASKLHTFFVFTLPGDFFIERGGALSLGCDPL